MNILVIAYEFPPICSAQSLRWHYLSAELAQMGHRVKVVTTDLRIRRDLAPATDPRVDVLRCFPGVFVGGANRLEQRLSGRDDEESVGPAPSNPAQGWASRGYRLARRLLDQIVFPDVRSEWYWFAAAALRRLDRSGYRPDLVIGSHEPGVDLQLAIAAKRRFGSLFIADLGDPVETVYSPRWRRRVDRGYEGYVLDRADGAVVTLESVRELLERRHPQRHGRIEVVPQGFDHRRAVSSDVVIPFCHDRLNILFTGTLYQSFRNPAGFLEAVARRSDVRLWIVGNLVGEFPAVSCGSGIQALGPLTHAQVLDAQAGADVLLSVGNRQADQIPGKIYEYFGARRPILHLYSTENDPSRELVRGFRRGWDTRCDVESSDAILDMLVGRQMAGDLEQGLDLSASVAERFSWRARAERLIQFTTSFQNQTQ